MCYNKNQADTEESEECTCSLDYTPPRIRSLRGDDGEKFDINQEHQPGTVQLSATQLCSKRNSAFSKHRPTIGGCDVSPAFKHSFPGYEVEPCHGLQHLL